MFTKLFDYLNNIQYRLYHIKRKNCGTHIETNKKGKKNITLPSTFEVRRTTCSHPYDVCNTQWSPLLPSQLPGPGNSATHKKNRSYLLSFPFSNVRYSIQKSTPIELFQFNKGNQVDKHETFNNARNISYPASSESNNCVRPFAT